jgi:hypothetical protein
MSSTMVPLAPSHGGGGLFVHMRVTHVRKRPLVSWRKGLSRGEYSVCSLFVHVK